MKKAPLPPILVSTLAPGTYSLTGERRSIVCPTCQAWTRVRKGALWPHDNDRGATCCESRRSVWFDLDVQQEAAGRRALELDARDAAKRPSTRGYRKPAPAVAAPVAYLGRERVPRRAQIAGWTQVELSKRDLDYANTAEPRR